jgi:hypothetical protein
MLTTLFNLFIISLGIAGFVVVFSKLRDQTTWLNVIVKALPYPFSKAITCTFCFGYWLGLAAALYFDPLSSWQPLIPHGGASLWPVLRILGAWYMLGLLATFWRLTYHITWKRMLINNQLAGEEHKH